MNARADRGPFPCRPGRVPAGTRPASLDRQLTAVPRPRFLGSAALRSAWLRSALLLLAVVAISSVACSDDDRADSPAGPAFLGVHIHPRGAGAGDPILAEAYITAAQADFDIAQFAFEWGEIELYAGVHDWTAFDLHVAQARIRQMPLAFELLLLDSQAPGRRPGDLASAAWDDPALLFRLASFLTEARRRADGWLEFVWLGREVDGYLVQNRGEVGPYRRLVEAIGESLAVVAPEVRTGTVVSWDEAYEEERLDIADSLARGAGWLGVTVYGRDLGWNVYLDPENAAARIRSAAERFPRVRVVAVETGYPGPAGETGPQEAFAANLVSLLADPPENLRGAIWRSLHDYTPEAAEEAAEELYAGEPLRRVAYAAALEALGLRAVNGVGKPTWFVLQAWNRDHPASVRPAPTSPLAPTPAILR